MFGDVDVVISEFCAFLFQSQLTILEDKPQKSKVLQPTSFKWIWLMLQIFIIELAAET